MKRKSKVLWTPFKRAHFPPPTNPLEKLIASEQVYRNTIYQVSVRFIDEERRWQGPVHLSIKRNDRAPAHDWRHFQKIKNELCGPEREAFEFYPPESQLIDSANQYHLWVLPGDMHMPLVWREGRWITDRAGDNAVQRPFEHPPADLEEMRKEFEKKYELAKQGELDPDNQKGELTCLATNSESSAQK